jgi:hypothetical protein
MITTTTLLKHGFKERKVNQSDYPFCSFGVIHVKKTGSKPPHNYPYLLEDFILIENQNGFHFWNLVYIGSEDHLKELYKVITGDELN